MAQNLNITSNRNRTVKNPYIEFTSVLYTMHMLKLDKGF